MKTVLIIEDELTVRESIVDLLEIQGFRVIAADNGKTGLQMALKERPDLVLCDISMPGLDGFGVLQKLRENPHTGAMPFIFLRPERRDLSSVEVWSLGLTTICLSHLQSMNC